VWSDDYTAPQGTPASHPTPAAQPLAKPTIAAEAARGNGAATAPAFKATTAPAITPKVPEPEVPVAPSAVDQLASILPEVEPVSGKAELPPASVAPAADLLNGLDLVEGHAEERAPAIVETASADVPASSEALIEPQQHEAVTPAIAGDDGLALDETPVAFEPEPSAEEDEFAWPDEATEIAAAPAAAGPEVVEEAAIHEPADVARVELVNEEPLVTEPAAAAITAAPVAPVLPAEVIASEPEPAELEPAELEPAELEPAELESEPLRFAGEPAAPARATVEPITERPGGGSDLGLLAAESHDDVSAAAEDPFESLADALEISDDELDVPSDVPAATAVQPARPAGSNGNGALSVTSAAKKSAAAFTDEDIDAALNEALRQLDGLDDLSEPTVPSRSRAAAR
jgi:hypothetical protein